MNKLPYILFADYHFRILIFAFQKHFRLHFFEFNAQISHQPKNNFCEIIVSRKLANLWNDLINVSLGKQALFEENLKWRPSLMQNKTTPLLGI